jgi:hypothetical protein
METPSQLLAARILKKLVGQKLLLEEDIRRLAPKLADGTLRPEDWQLAIEKAIDKKDSK